VLVLAKIQMKTHELAKALRALASLMEASPNIPIDQLQVANRTFPHRDTAQLAMSLSTLSDLSRVDKQQWMAFINELHFPIEIRGRDASRDILGKLLNYLESNPIARQQLKTKAATKGSKESPELMKALASLLKEPA
jgi:hypothetical protein